MGTRACILSGRSAFLNGTQVLHPKALYSWDSWSQLPLDHPGIGPFPNYEPDPTQGVLFHRTDFTYKSKISLLPTDNTSVLPGFSSLFVNLCPVHQ